MIMEKTMVLNAHYGLTCTYPMSGARLACQETNRVRVSKFKISFNFKVLSEVLDYSLDYNLLQFVYDGDGRLFNTVSCAISSARRFRTSAATFLSLKTFSLEYWRWHHLDIIQNNAYSTFIAVSRNTVLRGNVHCLYPN